MSGYVTFDSSGVFGPVITLLFQTPTTEDGLKATTKLLQTNFHHLSINRIYPTHRGEFCAYILKRINDEKKSLLKK